MPAAWLSYRNRLVVKKAALFSVIVSIPLATIIDYIATRDGSWYVPITIFPFRFLGIIPFEDYIWGFILIYLIVIYYEHFLDKGKNELFGKRMKILSVTLLVLLVAFFALLIMKPVLLDVRYAYFWNCALLLALPAIFFLINYPKLIFRYLKASGYFLILNSLHEYVGLKLSQWTFPGNNFIGWVEIGRYKLPFEELVFLLFIGALGILSYYEFFDDDRK